MGNIESVVENDLSNPKVGKVVYRKEKYSIKEIVGHYNSLIKRAVNLDEENKRLIRELSLSEKVVDKLKRELDQLKNVLVIKADGDKEEKNSKMTEMLPSGRYAVSAEQYVPKEEPKFFPKSMEAKNMIQDAFGRNDFLEHLDKTQLAALSECMTPVEVEAGHYIINEGEEGSCLYVVEEGELEVYKRGVKISTTSMRRGVLFGELAILYNCTRTASVIATTKTKLWCATRELFQGVMRYNVTVRRDEHFKFFKRVPVLSKIDEPMLKKLADASDEVYFNAGDSIFKEGMKGDTFYIIKNGTVDVSTKNEEGETTVLRTLTNGDSFGEKALLKDEIRSASVTAVTQVTCLTLSKLTFLGIHGEILDAMDKEYKKTVIEQAYLSHYTF